MRMSQGSWKDPTDNVRKGAVMNAVMEALRHRRSVRQYDGTLIPKEMLDQVLEAGLTEPTGDNYQSAEFIVIQDKNTLHDLAFIRKAGTRMLDKAGAAILVIGDESRSDLWMEDASIAMAYMHLAADSLGLGSCWIQIWHRDDMNGDDLEPVLRKKFDIPEHFHPMAILSLGNISAHPEGRHIDEKYLRKLHMEKY